MRDISAGHSPTAIPTMTEAAVSEGTPHAPHLAITLAHSALWPMEAPIAACTMTPTGIVTPHPTLTTSLADITHTTSQTRASLVSSTPTALHRNHSQEKLSNAQDLQPPQNPTIQRLSPSRIPLHILPQIQTVTLVR